MMTGNHRHKVTICLPGEAKLRRHPWKIWARVWIKDAPLFFHDGQTGSVNAAGIGTVVSAERAGSLPLEFRFAEGTFGEVVDEGCSRVNEETQHVVALFAQAPQQNGGRRLFNLPTPPRRGMSCRSD